MTRDFSPELSALAVSLMLSVGLATLGVAQDALSAKPGAVQHAMPQGGYIGTAAFRTADVTAPRGAVQHAMPAGGYLGTAASPPTAMTAACPLQGGTACPAPVQD